MFVLLAFYIVASGAVATSTAEFNTQESCEAARVALVDQVLAPTKVVVCVAK